MKVEIPRKYIEERLVTEREHPTEPYLIYNYTPECQFGKHWDDITMMCRGLILHKDTKEVIARPFPKFFNYEEHKAKGGAIPEEVPQVYDKRDGSLGILYWGTDGLPYIATRGSFTSDQATWATAWFRKHGDFMDWNKEYTHLFEIIYPENRIVLDYGEYLGLDLLAIIETKTGKEIKFTPFTTALGTPVRELPFSTVEELKALNEKNKEGFILHYPTSGLRLKVKFEDYVKLHKIITGLSERGIWEMLSQGKKNEEIIASVPDEMFDWVSKITTNLNSEYFKIVSEAESVLFEVRMLPTRKEQAEVITKSKYPGVVFTLLDNKNPSDVIWKMLKPRGSTTFRVDIDA